MTHTSSLPLDGDVRREVESYLRRTGWMPGRPGAFGELWSFRGAEEQRIAVPFALASDSREFQAVALRVAIREQRSQEAVANDIHHEFLDVQNYRIADSFVTDGSVPLEGAAAVLVSARRLTRAAATTSRRPRARIGSNYSPAADELASRARLSHTRSGSFLLPVVMPINPVESHVNQILESLQDVRIEAAERRVTRTLASALTALNSTISPGREVRGDDLLNLVDSGVSRELVSAVRVITASSGVHAFEVQFGWAQSVGRPGGVPPEVKISQEASPLLLDLEDKLNIAAPRRQESISGQIVEIRHMPGDLTGEIALRTIRNGRSVEVRILVQEAVVRAAADWFKEGRAALAHGEILSPPSRALVMPNPASVIPLDEIFLDGFSS